MISPSTRRRASPRARPRGPVLGRERREPERLDEEHVACEHRHGVAPYATRGRPAATLVTVVDDVVVEQRRHVDDLRRGGEIPRALVQWPEARAREKERERTDALAARVREVGRRLAGRAHPGRDPALQELLDLRHLTRHKCANFLDSRGRKLTDALGSSGLLKDGERGGDGHPVRSFGSFKNLERTDYGGPRPGGRAGRARASSSALGSFSRSQTRPRLAPSRRAATPSRARARGRGPCRTRARAGIRAVARLAGVPLLQVRSARPTTFTFRYSNPRVSVCASQPSH